IEPTVSLGNEDIAIIIIIHSPLNTTYSSNIITINVTIISYLNINYSAEVTLRYNSKPYLTTILYSRNNLTGTINIVRNYNLWIEDIHNLTVTVRIPNLNYEKTSSVIFTLKPITTINIISPQNLTYTTIPNASIQVNSTIPHNVYVYLDNNLVFQQSYNASNKTINLPLNLTQEKAYNLTVLVNSSAVINHHNQSSIIFTFIPFNIIENQNIYNLNNFITYNIKTYPVFIPIQNLVQCDIEQNITLCTNSARRINLITYNKENLKYHIYNITISADRVFIRNIYPNNTIEFYTSFLTSSNTLELRKIVLNLANMQILENTLLANPSFSTSATPIKHLFYLTKNYKVIGADCAYWATTGYNCIPSMIIYDRNNDRIITYTAPTSKRSLSPVFVEDYIVEVYTSNREGTNRVDALHIPTNVRKTIAYFGPVSGSLRATNPQQLDTAFSEYLFYNLASTVSVDHGKPTIVVLRDLVDYLFQNNKQLNILNGFIGAEGGSSGNIAYTINNNLGYSFTSNKGLLHFDNLLFPLADMHVLISNTQFNILYYDPNKNIAILRKNDGIVLISDLKSKVKSYILVNRFAEEAYYKTATQILYSDLMYESPTDGERGTIAILTTNRTILYPIRTTYVNTNSPGGALITSGYIIYFVEMFGERLENLNIKLQNSEYAYFFDFGKSTYQNIYIPSADGYARIFINLLNARGNCENYVFNLLGRHSIAFEFYRNFRSDFSCKVPFIVKPFDRLYKLQIYDKSTGTLIYETGSFLITQSEYYFDFNTIGKTEKTGTISLPETTINYTILFYNDTESNKLYARINITSSNALNFKVEAYEYNALLNFKYKFYEEEKLNTKDAFFNIDITGRKNVRIDLFRSGSDYRLLHSFDLEEKTSQHIDFMDIQKHSIPFAIYLLILVIGLLLIFNPILSIISSILVLIVFNVLGIINITQSSLLGLIIVIGIFITLKRENIFG
ncbi:MAG: hypothetical protein QXI77_02100, partial [Nanopusillaceae archaeon]